MPSDRRELYNYSFLSGALLGTCITKSSCRILKSLNDRAILLLAFFFQFVVSMCIRGTENVRHSCVILSMNLYSHEDMFIYVRVLVGFRRALRSKHTLILYIVNNVGLYDEDQGKPREADTEKDRKSLEIVKHNTQKMFFFIQGMLVHIFIVFLPMCLFFFPPSSFTSICNS